MLVEIKELASGEIKAQGSGSWLSHLEIGGAVLWRIDQDLPRWEPPKENLSDG